MLTKNIFVILLLVIQWVASAQSPLKKVLTEGDGKVIIMLAGGTADMSSYIPRLQKNYLLLLK